MSAFRDLEVVVLDPVAGAESRLREIRPVLLEEYRTAFGDRFEAELAETEDGSWVDVWRWVDRADAEQALQNRALIPSFAEWEGLVQLRSLTWARILPTSPTA